MLNWFLFGDDDLEDDDVEEDKKHIFKEMLLIPAWNEAGECIFLEAPRPIKSDLHPKLTSRVARNLTFLRYDI
jgi:hypothetical protein